MNTTDELMDDAEFERLVGVLLEAGGFVDHEDERQWAAPALKAVFAAMSSSPTVGTVTRAQLRAAIETVTFSEPNLDGILDALEALLGRAVPQAWQPIESAPKDGTKVLVTNDVEGALILIGYWVQPEDRGRDFCQDEDWWHITHALAGVKPTHWQPLPAPPGAPPVPTPPGMTGLPISELRRLESMIAGLEVMATSVFGKNVIQSDARHWRDQLKEFHARLSAPVPVKGETPVNWCEGVAEQAQNIIQPPLPSTAQAEGMTEEERRTLEGIDDMLNEAGHSNLALKYRKIIDRLVVKETAL